MEEALLGVGCDSCMMTKLFSGFRDHENFHKVEVGAVSGMDKLHFKLF